MPIDTSIYGEFRPPAQAATASPIQTIGALMALRGQMAEIPLRLAQAEHARQQAAQEAIITEQKSRDLRDQSTLQEAMGDPNIAPKIASGDLSPLYGKIQVGTLDSVRSNILKQHQEAATAEKSVLENRSTALNALAEGIQGLGEDPAQINANLNAFKSNPANQVLFKNAGIDPSTIPTVSDAADLKKWEAGVGVAQAVTNKALALKESQAKEAQTEAETGKALAETEHQNLINKMLQGAGTYNASSGVHPVDQVLPASTDKAQNASYKAAYDAAMKQPPDQNGRHPAADTILEQAAAHAAALSPTLLANKAKTAAAEETARIPGEVSRAVQVARAVAPIEENRALKVASVNRASVGAEKLDTEYNTAKTSAEQVGRVLDLIDQGNKAAGGALVPLNAAAINAVENIKRMSRIDIEQAGGQQAGNLWDRLSGYTEKQLKGDASIVPEIRQQMGELQQSLAEGAHSKYVNGLKSIEQREKLPPGTLAPTIPPPVIRSATAEVAALPAAARAQLKEGHNTTFANGQVWTLRNGQPEKLK